MTSSDLSSASIQNRLLRGLSRDLLARLLPHSELVELSLKQRLHTPGGRVAHAYFPLSGMVSMVISLEDGGAIEVGTIGSEGLVGLSLLVGGDIALHEAMVQMEGSALRISAAKFRNAVADEERLRVHLGRYIQSFQFQVSQTAACNASHPLEQRCARWLLLARHRVASDHLPLTQEFLSMMLAVRRAGVSVAAGTLQQAGFIRYRHGQITILDPAGLEQASCECYRRIKETEERLLG